MLRRQRPENGHRFEARLYCRMRTYIRKGGRDRQTVIRADRQQGEGGEREGREKEEGEEGGREGREGAGYGL